MGFICTKALAIAFSAMALLTGPAFAAAPSARSAGPRIDVMTVNLEHKDRPSELKAAADYLRTELDRVPDFILCQEVMFKRSGEHKDTAAVLANELGYESRGTKRKSDREGL